MFHSLLTVSPHFLVSLSVPTRVLLPCWYKPSLPEDLLLPTSVSLRTAEGGCRERKIYVFIKPCQGEWGSHTQKNEDTTEQGFDVYAEWTEERDSRAPRGAQVTGSSFPQWCKHLQQ